jgi:hypothetical protein
MKEDVFKQTELIKKNIVSIIRTIDEVNKTLHQNKDLKDEIKKLTYAKELLQKSVNNIDEIEHLVIVSAVGRTDF